MNNFTVKLNWRPGKDSLFSLHSIVQSFWLRLLDGWKCIRRTHANQYLISDRWAHSLSNACHFSMAWQPANSIATKTCHGNNFFMFNRSHVCRKWPNINFESVSTDAPSLFSAGSLGIGCLAKISLARSQKGSIQKRLFQHKNVQ